MSGVKVRSVLLYTVLRLLAFLVPLGIMMLFPVFQELYWIAIFCAALIGLSLSMIFLRGPRDAISSGLAARRTAHPHKSAVEVDTEVEDAVDDERRHDIADGAAPAATETADEHQPHAS